MNQHLYVQLVGPIFQFHSREAKGSIRKAQSEVRSCLVCPEGLHRLNGELQGESDLCPQNVQVQPTQCLYLKVNQ